MTSASDKEDMDLRDVMKILLRRKAVIAAAVAVALGVSFLAALLQRSVYKASAEILLEPVAPSALSSGNPSSATADQSRRVQNEVRLIESQTVRKAAFPTGLPADLGSHLSVSASTPGGADIIVVRAQAATSAGAALVANRFADAYINVRQQTQADELSAATKAIADRISALDQQLNGSNTSVGASDRAGLLARRQDYQRRIDDLAVSAELVRSGGARVISPATPPGTPSGPKPTRDLTIGALAGFVGGIALAMLVEHFDDAVQTVGDLERTTGEATLAAIPRSSGGGKGAKTVATRAASLEPSDSYRSFRTVLEVWSAEHPMRLMQMTTPRSGAWCSQTVANLGVAFARAEQRVLLVAADMRKSDLATIFGIENAPGLADLLVTGAAAPDVIRLVDGHSNLFLLPPGGPVPNPADILAGKRTAELFKYLREYAEVILVDSPPVLSTTDALIVSRFVDATVLIANAGETSTYDERRATELLHQVAAPLIGNVLHCNSEVRHSHGMTRS